jgi:hypothetical protein
MPKKAGRSIEKIKAIMRQDKIPVVIATHSLEPVQTFELFQYTRETFFQGGPIKAGSYLIIRSDCTATLNEEALITPVENVEPFQAFFIGGGLNASHAITLDNSQDIVLVTPLTGCSFAAELDSSTPTVAHVNWLTYCAHEDMQVVDQPLMDNEITKLIDTSRPNYTVKKSDYKSFQGDHHAAAVIGFRGENDWQYLSQYTIYNDQNDSFTILRGKSSHMPTPTFFSQPPNSNTTSVTPTENLDNSKCTIF